MASYTILKKRLQVREETLAELYDAYVALAKGGVQSYTIGSRSLTKFDLAGLMDEIRKLENEVDELENLLNGSRRRKAVGVIPRDL